MAGKYGYWIDLEATQFDEDGSWIQAFPEGTYQHPLFGEMVFDQERLKRFADSAATKVRGTDLDIDYDHKLHTGEAAGWVKEAEYRPGQGLHIRVEWTPKAREAIKNKEYKYFSPEFMDEWTHPKTGKTHKDVLNGGALTNRPFLKDILPVNLSELMLHEQPKPTTPSEEGDPMDPKELRKALGLAEDATDEQVTAKLSELRQLHALVTAPPQDPPPTPQPTPPAPPAPTTTAKTVPELLAQLSDVNKDHPAVKMLTQIMDQQRTTIESQQKALREIEVEQMLADLDRGKKFAVPPAVKEQLREILLKSSKELGEQVYTAYMKTLELGVVDLNEYGWQRKGESVSSPTALNAEVAKLMEADKNLTYADAYRQVGRMRPDLVQAVRQDSYIKDGV